MVARELLYPVQLRFGIGVGIITTEIARDAIGMDGPAFYDSRRALEQAKREGREVRFQGLGEELDMAVNTLALLLSALTSQRTERQFEVVGLYRKLGTHARVAQELGVSRASVTKTLSAAQWEAVGGVRRR